MIRLETAIWIFAWVALLAFGVGCIVGGLLTGRDIRRALIAQRQGRA